MRDELNNRKPTKNECLILNLDHSSNKGTHWVCMFIKEGVPYYFDSYGFRAPSEVIDYFKGFTKFYYDNSFKIQKYSEVICGHYSIYVLYKLSNGFDFYAILDELYRWSQNKT